MKRILYLFCAFCLVFPLAACGGKEKAPAKRYDYDLNEYVTVPDPNGVKAEFYDPAVCTEEELDEAIFQIMLSHASFAKKDGGIVEMYNKVKISYSIEQDGKILEDYSDEDFQFIIGYDGNSDLNAALAKALLGKAVGEKASAEHTFPQVTSELGAFAGKTVTVHGEILEIYQQTVSECTDDFAKQFDSEGIETVAELRAYLENEILEGKQNAKEYAVLNAYLDGVKVKKYPEAEFQAYIEKYMQEVKDAAAQMEMSYDEYITVCLKMTAEEVDAAAKSDAKTRVRNDLACIQGSRLMGTTLTDEEYKEALESYYLNEEGSFASAEEFEEYYTKDILYESILWDKTFLSMLDQAIRLEPGEVEE